MGMNRLCWDLMNLIPGPGRTISHVRLAELLQQEYRRDELPESFSRKVLNQLNALACVAELQLCVNKVDRVYYYNWSEEAARLPIVKNNIKETK
jgi:hypothetical protein